MNNKTILVFGGTGSLGYEITKRYFNNNKIYNFSRDECKHWNMKLYFNSHSNLNFIIGDDMDYYQADNFVISNIDISIFPTGDDPMYSSYYNYNACNILYKIVYIIYHMIYIMLYIIYDKLYIIPDIYNI